MESAIISKLKSEGFTELTRLFTQHRQYIRDLISRRINPRLGGRLDASDIVQETYLRACSALENYLNRPAVPPLVWIRQLSKQILSETHRKQFRKLRTPFVEAEIHQDYWLEQSLLDSVESVGARLEKEEIALMVRELLKELSDLDREIIEMRHIEDQGLREIAQVLEIPFETAKKRYFRAIRRFRLLFDQHRQNQS